jgi:aminoglycoside phosphotransferase family enzyme/predicted kinase
MRSLVFACGPDTHVLLCVALLPLCSSGLVLNWRMEFARLHKALLDAAAYPEGAREVSSLQTHVSELFFAGDLVYKVKKPVDLGFLDFSTLAQRRRACEEEVRLNADLAPGVYRRVAPIVAAGGGVRIAHDDETVEHGEVVEYAVEMVRLPAERMLDRVLEQGALDEGVLDEIVERLARFHGAAATGPGVDEHSSPEALRRKFTDTLGRLDVEGARESGVEGGEHRGHRADLGGTGAAASTISAELLEHLRRWLLGELAARRGLIEARARDGRVREGHGDLHAGNICLDPRAPGGLLMYDRIEFSRPLRCLDVAAEIAFLAMDLAYHGHVELAAALTERYAERTNDPEFVLLQPMHRCHYAAVRGMVDSIREGEAEVGADQRQEAWRSARRHLDLALGYAVAPALVVMCGLPGTGKSTAARPIARALQAEWLRSDEIRREGQAPAIPSARDRYAPEAVEAVYDGMIRRSRAALARGRSIVADATYSTRARRAAMIAAAEDAGARWVVVWVTAPDDVVRERIEGRARAGRDPSEADFGVYLAAKKKFEPPVEVDRRRLVTVDGRTRAEVVSRAAIESLIG